MTPQGLYCAAGDFHIDPWTPVPRAVITHGHSDHARSGHGAVLATRETLDIMALRYGPMSSMPQQAIRLFGEQLACTHVLSGRAGVVPRPTDDMG